MQVFAVKRLSAITKPLQNAESDNTFFLDNGTGRDIYVNHM